jgi:hypothetical protein
MKKIRRALDEDARLRREATEGPWQARFLYRLFRAARKDRGLLMGAEEKDWQDAEFIDHARNTDLGSCLRIAVEALRQIAASAVKEEALYGWEVRHKKEALETLAQIAALLPDEEGQ